MTLTNYTSTILCIDYYHIRNKNEDKANMKKEKSWIIKVVNLILNLMTLTSSYKCTI